MKLYCIVDKNCDYPRLCYFPHVLILSESKWLCILLCSNLTETGSMMSLTRFSPYRKDTSGVRVLPAQIHLNTFGFVLLNTFKSPVREAGHFRSKEEFSGFLCFCQSSHCTPSLFCRVSLWFCGGILFFIYVKGGFSGLGLCVSLLVSKCWD